MGDKAGDSARRTTFPGANDSDIFNPADHAIERGQVLDAFVASVEHLPLFSGTAMQLIRSVEREDISSGELSRIILSDAALVAHLVRIVNSAYYGLSRRIATVPDALAVLGFDMIRRAVTVAVLQRPLLAYLHDTASARAFWRHQLLCASLARHLALKKGLDGEVAYMAGLMHDVGRLAMMMHFRDEPELLRQGADDEGPEYERIRFGFDHAEVGGALLSLWKLPDPIVDAASRHGDDTEPADPMAASVWNANLLSHEMAEASGPDDEEATPWMTAILTLTAEARRRMLEEIAALESEQG